MFLTYFSTSDNENVIGNKCDLEDQDRLTTSKRNSLVMRRYIEVSAKDVELIHPILVILS